MEQKYFKWEPWESDADDKNYRLDITEPPCKFCACWNPKNIFKKDGSYKGVICCTEKEMYPDFSCYEKRV